MKKATQTSGTRKSNLASSRSVQPATSRQAPPPTVKGVSAPAREKQAAGKGYKRSEVPVPSSEAPADEGVDTRLKRAQNYDNSLNINQGVISQLLFTISTDEDIRGGTGNGAFCKVTTVKPGMSMVGPGCLLDPQMGPSEPKQPCPRCAGSIMTCPGHPGYIDLAAPIFHPAFISSTLIILKLFCYTHWNKSNEARETWVYKWVREWISEHKKEYEAKKLIVPENAILRKMAMEEKDCPTVELIPCFNPIEVQQNWGNIHGTARLKLIESNRQCKKCIGDVNPVEYAITDYYFIYQKLNDASVPMDPEDVKTFFTAIDNDNIDGEPKNWASLLGFGNNKLSSLVMKAWPVMSNIHRHQKMIAGTLTPHAFTTHYKMILEENIKLQEKIDKAKPNLLFPRQKSALSSSSDFDVAVGATENAERAAGVANYRTLCENINNLVFAKDEKTDNRFDTEHHGGRVVVSVMTTINGKYGVLRHDVAGKGSDHSGRAVLIGDPEIMVDEVGISEVFAESMTIPEEILSEEDVTYWTQHMPQIVNGKRKIGQIKKVIKRGHKEPLDLEYHKEIYLEVGDVVRRRVIEGDILVITRQPVLHKGGIQGFKARIFAEGGNVIRIHPSVTGPFNADFDGDEMNMAVPQTLASRQDVGSKMMVTNCVRGDQYSSPWIGLIQNPIVAAKRMTAKSTTISPSLRDAIIMEGIYIFTKSNPGGKFRTSGSDFMQELYSLERNLDPTSGRAILSFFFPIDFHYERKSKGKEDVIVEKGFLISGQLDKYDVGKESGGFVDAILEQYDAETVVTFLSAITSGLYKYIEVSGFTLGPSDCVLDTDESHDDPQGTIDSLVEAAKESVKKSLEGGQSGVLATLALAEVDKVLAGLGDRINDIVKSGGVDIVAKKKALAAEAADVELQDTLNVSSRILDTLEAEHQETIRQPLPEPSGAATRTQEDQKGGINFESEAGKRLVQYAGIKPDATSFGELVRSVIQNVRFGKRTGKLEEKLLIEIEVFKILTQLLQNSGEEVFQPQEETAFASLKFMLAEPIAIRELMQKRLQEAIYLRAKIVGADRFDNNFLFIVYSGAKGTASNVTQVLGSVGPQERELLDRNPITDRTLPFVERGDRDPVSNGFVASSFGRGLNPIEFWHHAQASRGNIIESNLKPKDTGYAYRRAWILLGDITTYEDGTARNESGRIVQFAYGGDMFDPRRLINVQGEPQFVHVSMAAKRIRSAGGKAEFQSNE